MDRELQQTENSIVLPVYEPYARRPGQANPGGDPQVWEQAYHNCYPEKTQVPETGQTDSYSIVKRPPLWQLAALTPTIASYGTAATMTCLANMCMTQLSDVYVCAMLDTTAQKVYILQYRPLAGTSAKIGELTGVNFSCLVFLTEIIQNVGGTYPAGTLTPALAVTIMKQDRTIIANSGWYAVTSGGVFTAASLTQIASNYPSQAGGGSKTVTGPIIQMNGTNYVMTTEGTVCCSGSNTSVLYDITVWNTNGIVAASMYPDLGVGLARYKNLIVAVGKSSLEFFQDSQIPPPASPLTRVEQAMIKFGCPTPKGIINIDDTIYWIAYSTEGTMGVWKLEGYQPIKISIPRIDYGMATLWASQGPDQNEVSLECVLLHNRKHLVLNGCLQYTLGGVYNSVGGISNFDGTDSFVTGGLTSYIALYHLEDKVWWGMSGAGTPSWRMILPASTQSATGLRAWQQYIFMDTTSNFTNQTVTIMQFPFVISALYVDFLTPSAQTPADYVYVIPAYFQLNTKWFGTARKKRINKITVICDLISRVSGVGTADTNVYSMYIGLTKETGDISQGTTTTGTPSSTLVKSVNLSTTTREYLGRYYANNWGTCRSAAIFVNLTHPGSLRVHGVQVDIDQFTR